MDAPTTDYLPRFLVFLTKVSEAVERKAEEEEMGRVSHEVVQLRERNDSSNGLSCVRLTYTDEEGVERGFKLFAAGECRGKSMVKIEKEDDSPGNGDSEFGVEKEYVLISSNPSLILAWISF